MDRFVGHSQKRFMLSGSYAYAAVCACLPAEAGYHQQHEQRNITHYSN